MVYIVEMCSIFDNECFVCIWSFCGLVDDGYLLCVLEINGEVYYGVLVIQDFVGWFYFVMCNNYLSVICDFVEICSLVLVIVKCSDEVELMLMGKDIY